MGLCPRILIKQLLTTNFNGMAILKKSDATPKRPVIITIYGQAGSGKTSIATTAGTPLLIDTDRGFDRAINRCDTLIANNWDEILSESESMKGYKTVIVDTARATLDDFLVQYAISKDYKLRTNTLKRFGQIGDDFKTFVNMLRSNGSDIIFICHDKETAEGDVIKHSPDCTGQSKDLLLRISDQVGYMSVINKKRCISFDPTETLTGKNVAKLPTMEVPDETDPAFPTFMAEIIEKVKDSIQRQTEEQKEALNKIRELSEAIALMEEAEQANAISEDILTLTKMQQAGIKAQFMARIKEVGIKYDKEQKKFVKE